MQLVVLRSSIIVLEVRSLMRAPKALWVLMYAMNNHTYNPI